MSRVAGVGEECEERGKGRSLRDTMQRARSLLPLTTRTTRTTAAFAAVAAASSFASFPAPSLSHRSL